MGLLLLSGGCSGLGSRPCSSGLRSYKRFPLLCEPGCPSTLRFPLAPGWESGGLGSRPCPFPGLFLPPLPGVPSPSSAAVPRRGSRRAHERRWTREGLRKGQVPLWDAGRLHCPQARGPTWTTLLLGHSVAAPPLGRPFPHTQMARLGFPNRVSSPSLGKSPLPNPSISARLGDPVLLAACMS